MGILASLTWSSCNDSYSANQITGEYMYNLFSGRPST